MRELLFRANVTGCEDMRVAGLQIVIGDDSVSLVILHTGGLEIHTFHVGCAADADQDGVNIETEFIIGADQIDDLLISVHTNVDGFGIEMDADSVARQGVRKNLRGVALLIAEEHRIILDDADLRTQSTKGLREFASKRTAAENEQARRTFGEVEDIFIGEVTCFGDSGSRRRIWEGTARDKSALEAQAFSLDLDGVGCNKARFSKIHIDTRGAQPLC